MKTLEELKQIDKNFIERINELTKWAYDTNNTTERARRLAKAEGYHEAYVDIIFALGLEKELFKTSVI